MAGLKSEKAAPFLKESGHLRNLTTFSPRRNFHFKTPVFKTPLPNYFFSLLVSHRYFQLYIQAIKIGYHTQRTNKFYPTFCYL